MLQELPINGSDIITRAFSIRDVTVSFPSIKMGVTNFWQLLLEDWEEKTVSLSSLSGQTWAVDLSTWIVHGRTAASTSGVSQKYTLMKTIFHRTLCLLKHGIIPVFVMDGRQAPAVKEKTIQRRSQAAYGHTKAVPSDRSSILSTNKMCQNLLESLGLTVITSPGEAEKTCAFLNHRNVVDACLTEDCDAFLYGATKVYRCFNMDKKTVECHTMEDIEKKLQLNRHDLVLLALLGGCDYGDGVMSIGPKKACELIRGIKQYEYDVLNRVLNWRDSTQLRELSKQEEQLKTMQKVVHCSNCQHPGRKPQHKNNGCAVCQTEVGCADDRSAVCCTCPFHSEEKKISPFRRELGVWRKAMETEGFPNRELVREFLQEEDGTNYPARAAVTLPNWVSLTNEVKHLNMDGADLMKYMVPVLVHMHLHNTLDVPGAKPLPILKTCTRQFVTCYQVPWERFDFDQWTPHTVTPQEKTPDSKGEGNSDVYTVDVPRELFEMKYPALVRQFKPSASTSKKTGKRPAMDPSQRKLTDMFPLKRKLFQEKKD